MKQAAVFLSIFSFTLLSAYLSFFSQTIESESEISRIVTFEAIAYSKRIPTVREPVREVLGTASVRTMGVSGKNALEVLMDSHPVIIEHMEEGTRVVSIDGVGLSDEDRLSDKKWVYFVNGVESSLSADKYISNPTDVILWNFR